MSGRIDVGIITAAGRGSRFGVFTKTIPKELLPIEGIPAIEYVIDECWEAGIRKIIVWCRANNNALQLYLTTASKYAKYIITAFSTFDSATEGIFLQQSPERIKYGNGSSIFFFRQYLQGKRFSVSFADDVIVNGNSFKKMISSPNNDKTQITICRKPDYELTGFGNVQVNENLQVQTIIQKPDKYHIVSSYALISRLILNDDIIPVLLNNKEGEIDLGEALNILCKKENVQAYELEGSWLCIDTPERYLEAQEYMRSLKSREDEQDFLMGPIIDHHATWISVNPIQGCSNNCAYCFLQEKNGTGIRPICYCSPAQAVDKLINSVFYTKNEPVAFFTQTDIFATKDNRSYFCELVDEIIKRDITNPLVFITKREITEPCISSIKKLVGLGKKIVFYLSYSGLSEQFEDGIAEEKIKKNFIILYQMGIPIVHYFRPITPLNGTKEKIQSILEYTSNYAVSCVFTGLKLSKTANYELPFWPEFDWERVSDDVECYWPEGARQRIYSVGKKLGFPVYEENACALALALDRGNHHGFFCKEKCIKKDNCPIEQKERCECVWRPISKEKVIKALSILGHNVTNCISINENSIILPCSLSSAEIHFLTYLFNRKILAAVKSENNAYWGTSIKNNRGLEL